MVSLPSDIAEHRQPVNMAAHSTSNCHVNACRRYSPLFIALFVDGAVAVTANGAGLMHFEQRRDKPGGTGSSGRTAAAAQQTDADADAEGANIAESTNADGKIMLGDREVGTMQPDTLPC